MKSISLRLILVIAAIATGAVLVAGASLTLIGSNVSREAAMQEIQLEAQKQAAQVADLVNQQGVIGRVIASAGTNAVETGDADRTAFESLLIRFLKDNPQLLGTWAGFDTNQFDGLDRGYAGTIGHDDTGRFVPYASKNAEGTIIVDPLVDYDKPGAGDYYLLAHETGEPQALEPYPYEVGGETQLITTLAFPILEYGEIVGVGGVDILLQDVANLLKDEKPLGEGYVSVISEGGTFIADQNAASIGKPALEAGMSEKVVQTVKQHKEAVYTGMTARSGENVVRAVATIDLYGIAQDWAVVVTVPEARVFAATNNLIMASVAVALVVIALATGIAWYMSRTISRPITGMTAAMKKLAAGQHDAEIPARERADEIGAMAGAVQVFKENAIEMERVKTQQEEERKQAAEDKRRAMDELAGSFEQSVGQILQSVVSGSTQLRGVADNLSRTAEETGLECSAVASASEEMSASIGEIAQQMSQSSGIAADAVGKAEANHKTMASLSEAAQRVGAVVEMINDIANQTNLLALNATIEAARAGDAGKGFAVVASEVKDLADQTAKATEEISGQIADMQNVTTNAVDAIDDIRNTIVRIREAMTSVSSAVEEQSAATQEISRNTQQAAQGTHEVSESISRVQQGATKTSSSVKEMAGATNTLDEQARTLEEEVKRFLDHVRAA